MNIKIFRPYLDVRTIYLAMSSQNRICHGERLPLGENLIKLEDHANQQIPKFMATDFRYPHFLGLDISKLPSDVNTLFLMHSPQLNSSQPPPYIVYSVDALWKHPNKTLKLTVHCHCIYIHQRKGKEKGI